MSAMVSSKCSEPLILGSVDGLLGAGPVGLVPSEDPSWANDLTLGNGIWFNMSSVFTVLVLGASGRGSSGRVSMASGSCVRGLCAAALAATSEASILSARCLVTRSSAFCSLVWPSGPRAISVMSRALQRSECWNPGLELPYRWMYPHCSQSAVYPCRSRSLTRM